MADTHALPHFSKDTSPKEKFTRVKCHKTNLHTLWLNFQPCKWQQPTAWYKQPSPADPVLPKKTSPSQATPQTFGRAVCPLQLKRRMIFVVISLVLQCLLNTGWSAVCDYKWLSCSLFSSGHVWTAAPFDPATTVQHQHKRWVTLLLIQALCVHVKPSAACTTASSNGNLLALFLQLVQHITLHWS